MMVWIHDMRSGSDVLVNSEYVSSVEQDEIEHASFHIRMANHDVYTVIDEDAAAWLTMRKS